MTCFGSRSHRAAGPLPGACAPALPRLRGPGRGLPEEGRAGSGQGVRHTCPGHRSQEPSGPQKPGRYTGTGGRRVNPQDPQTVYGLAFAYMKLGDMELAQKHFQAVLEMEAPEELRGLARGGHRGGPGRGVGDGGEAGELIRFR